MADLMLHSSFQYCTSTYYEEIVAIVVLLQNHILMVYDIFSGLSMRQKILYSTTVLYE